MSKTSWREISLAALDDPSIQWRTRSLVPRSSVPRREANAEGQNVEQFNSRSVDIGGSFRIEGQDATDERLILWWSLAERSDTVDVLEIKLGAHLEGNAVVYHIPEGMHVMENGVKWFNKRGVESDTLVLAVATTCGKGFTAYFGEHPGAPSNSNRTWNETHSFLWEKNKAAIEKVYSSSRHGRRHLVQACCWFQNAKGVIALATVASNGESDASSEITFQSIPDTSMGEEAFSGRRLITKQASRSSFTFGNSTLGEEDQTNKVVYLGAFCRSILNQGLENSVSMPEDDTLIAAVYDDGSLHFASINYEQSPTKKINLLSLYDKVSRQDAVAADGVVEEAWIETVAVAENNRDISLELAIGIRLSSSRPILYTTKCSLGTSSISFEEETKIFNCPNTVFRGYKLVDMKVHDGKLLSVWWKPVNSPSTLAIAHDIHGGDWSIKDFATIPMDAERTKLLDEDRVAESEKNLDTAFEARLALPGRFSTCELSDGLVSCFGRQQASNALRNVPEVHRKDVLNAAKRLVAQRTTQLQQSGGSQDQQAYRQVACTTWRRFVQACEVCWLHGHQVLAAGIADVGPGAGAGLIVVRRNRITCFQPTKPLEDGLYLAATTSNDVTNGILATVQNCAEWTRPMLAFKSDSLGSFGNGKNELLRKVRSSLLEIDNYDDIESALAELLSVVDGPKDFLIQLEAVLDDLWVTPASPCIDEEELPTKGIPPRSILAQMTADRVLQILEARLTLGLTVLVVLEALSIGIPSYKNFFSVYASRQRQEMSNKIAKQCCTEAIVLYLGNFAPLEVERSLDWIRRFTMPPSDRSTPSARTTATGSVLASSVFAHLVTSVLATDSTLEVETLADRVCQLEETVLPFLDAEQQYHVLATVAKASGRCLGDPDPASEESWYKGYENMYRSPKDRHIYFSMLQAKNSIWKSATEPEGDLTNYDRQALLFLQASTPHVSQDSTVLLDFMMHTMHLFGLAKKPSLALEFAFQAIKLPSCTRDQKRKLAKYIFAYALDMKDYKVAFAASRLCPRNEQGSSLKMFEGDRYLGQLVAIMMDHGAVKELCELPFQTCGEYVWREAIIKTIMRKTEASPPLLTAETGEDTPTLYHIAYSFCVSHVRFIEAVKCMYIMAHRLVKEVHDKFNDSWDVNMLYKLQCALQTAHSTFLLVPESKRTFFLNFKPRFFWETETWTSGTDSDMKAGKIYPVTWEDVRKMFSLARWAHSLMSKLGEHMRIPSNGMEPKALLANLCCCGHVDEAALLVTMFDQDATEMFRYLTESCIDEPFSGPRWRKIQSLLKMLDKVEVVDAETGEKKFLYVYTYHTVVTETLLSLRPRLAIPHWLMSSFLSWGEFASSPQSHIHAFAKQTSSKNEKVRNPALLIRILVKYNVPESLGKANAQKNRQLEEACTLATDLIVYTRDFPIHSEPPILPLRTLDLLMARCEMAQVSNLKELQSAVRDYARQLALTPYDTDSSLARNLCP